VLGEPLALARVLRIGLLGERGQHLAPEELEGLADVLVAVAARLGDEDHLVDAGGTVALEELAHLPRGPDRTAERAQPALEQPQPQGRVPGADDLTGEAAASAVPAELVPDAGQRRAVLAEDVVVGERVAEEVGAVDAPLDGRHLVPVAHEGQDHGDVGVDREARGHAVVGGEDRVVVVHPAARLLGLDEGERERADATAGGEQDGVAAAAGDPQRRVRLLLRLGDDVARRDREEAAAMSREGLLDQHPGDDVERLRPLGASARGRRRSRRAPSGSSTPRCRSRRDRR
jgi:hypothetical protein